MSNTRRHMLYSVQCRHCHASHHNGVGIMLWLDKGAAINAALDDGWLMHRGRLYCPTCVAEKQYLPPSYRPNYKPKERDAKTNKLGRHETKSI